MRNAITYKDLYLSLGKVISIEELKVVQKPNCHGELYLSAVLDCEPDEISYYELPDTVTVHYMEEEEEKILFKGTIADSSMNRVGEHMHIRLKAYDATWLLDTAKRTRSFQNINRTNHSVIEEIMKAYPECICMKNLPEGAIGQIWFQYEETDWEFLCRFVSHYAESLYADATYQTARFQAGLSPENIDVEWEECPYCMGKDLAQYDLLSQNGFPELDPSRFVEYFIDSYDLYTLGSRLTYKNREWYIGSLERNLKEGILVCTYELKQKEAMSATRKYSKRITGISVDGRITEVNRDKVRVTINGDLTTEQGTYWFPFSTVAASSDGSGWYSMPETGDSIRVYFPTKDEKEAYVITKHDSHMPAAPGAGSSSSAGSPTGGGSSGGSSGGGGSSGSSSGGGGFSGGGGSSGGGGLSGGVGSSGGSAAAGMSAAMAAAGAMDTAEKKKENPMDDPSKRNIFTQDGNIVQMTKEGVILSSGTASLSLLKTGNIVFNAPGGFYISTVERLTVRGENITMKASRMMEQKNSKGADVKTMRTNITMKANEIFEN